MLNGAFAPFDVPVDARVIQRFEQSNDEIANDGIDDEREDGRQLKYKSGAHFVRRENVDERCQERLAHADDPRDKRRLLVRSEQTERQANTQQGNNDGRNDVDEVGNKAQQSHNHGVIRPAYRESVGLPSESNIFIYG